MMTPEFIQKRIAEQREYIDKVMRQQQDGKTAMSVLEYFEKKYLSESDILEEIDDLLARLEDFTKGEDGKEITRLRGKINKIRIGK